MFKKYQHIEKLNTQETYDIEIGRCFIFPKIDGTCSEVWQQDGVIKCGSRNRELSEHADNGGFYQACMKTELHDKLVAFFQLYPNLRLFGEFLIPHTLRTYRDDAWRKFYIFDVVEDIAGKDSDDGDSFRYLSYDEYKPMLDVQGLDYIVPLGIATNPTTDQLLHYLHNNTYLIQDGKGIGEGIVIKRYDFKNKYGRTTWAKVVATEFKEKHIREMGAPEIKSKPLLEQEIVEEFVTEALVEKTYAKIVTENNGWSQRFIPQLLGTVYYDLVREECWSFVKKHKMPVIDFKALSKMCEHKIKTIKADLF